MSDLRKTNLKLFGTILTGPVSARKPKDLARLVSDLSRELHRLGYDNFEVTAGIRIDENVSKACVRFVAPSGSGRFQAARMKKKLEERVKYYIPRFDEFQFGGPRHQEYVRPWVMELATMWHAVTRLSVYRGIPFVLCAQGRFFSEANAALGRVTLADREGLDIVLGRLVS
ncbi:hypothetical protein BJX61DRAFT_541300 [Aspergillus egyptiacus]|nr:hypothetical protein BJX61DRAFT_541300 [Aspergillus egyptiacus]